MYLYVRKEVGAVSHGCMKEGKVGACMKHHVCQWDPMAAEVSP